MRTVTKVEKRDKKEKNEEQLSEVEKVKKALEQNGHGYLFIDTAALPVGSITEDQLRDHFRAFKPAKVSCTSDTRLD